MLIIFLDGKTALPPAVANLYGQNQKAKRPYNWVVINTKDNEGNNRLQTICVENGGIVYDETMTKFWSKFENNTDRIWSNENLFVTSRQI